jgi:hypothetical protein
MKLDRNLNKDGKGKYALIQLRKVRRGSEEWRMLLVLHEKGILEWGYVGDIDEFFTIKLRDKYSDSGLRGYRTAVEKDAAKNSNDNVKFKDLMEYARQILDMENRSGSLSEFCKDPD